MIFLSFSHWTIEMLWNMREKDEQHTWKLHGIRLSEVKPVSQEPLVS
jgi:hypothetical protein